VSNQHSTADTTSGDAPVESAPLPSSATRWVRPAVRSSRALLALAWDDLRRFLVDHAEVIQRTPGFAAFFEALGEVERERFERLWAVVRAIEHGGAAAAAQEAESLLRRMPDEDDGDGAAAVRTFAEALLGRIHKRSGSGGNLYLGARPPGAQLRAFELLRLRTPFIPFGYAAANRALLDAIREPVEVTLLDVGIGRGGQVRALLRNPWARRLIRSLHVIGVEPDSSPDTGGALQTAQLNVLGAAHEAGIPATFAGIGKLAEQLSTDDLAAARPRGLLLASCSFSLHHVGLPEHGAPRGRDEVLSTIRDAGFGAIVLLEPDTNHDEDDLALRFLYAYRHYGTLARSLHATLRASDAVLVWSEFFAEEIRNVIAHDGALRAERHEEADRWVERLAASGFTVDTPAELVAPSAAPAGFEVVHTGRAATLRYDGVSLLAVLRARAV
jgi:GRAS domain family